MARTRKLTVEIAGETRGLSSLLGTAERKVGGLGSKFATLGKTAAIGLGAAAVAGVALGKGFVDAAIESQKATKQTEAVLKSMGGSAGVTAKQVASMSEKLSMQSGIDDELIQSGQNVLLTFGKIQNKVGKGNKIFDRATASALDMSVALGTDLKTANIQVGKALNDPIKGITALSRAGVSFTQKQKDTIKSLVETGDTLGAQKIILGELEKQFGGSAAAQATAGEKLKVVWGNLQEQLGGYLLPVLEKVAGFLADKLPGAMAFLEGVLGPVAAKVAEFWNALTSGQTEDEGTPIERFALKVRDAAAAVTEFVQGALEGLGRWWRENGPAITSAMGDLATAFTENVWPAIKEVWKIITEKLVPALGDITGWILRNQPILAGLATLVGVHLAGAFLAWAGSVGAAAVATVIAMGPVIVSTAIIIGLVVATQWLIDKFNLMPKASRVINGAIYGVIWVVNQLISALRTAKDLLQDLQDVGKNAGKNLIPGLSIPNAVGGFISGHFPQLATGGPVSLGRSYWVGDGGELTVRALRRLMISAMLPHHLPYRAHAVACGMLRQQAHSRLDLSTGMRVYAEGLRQQAACCGNGTADTLSASLLAYVPDISQLSGANRVSSPPHTPPWN